MFNAAPSFAHHASRQPMTGCVTTLFGGVYLPQHGGKG